MVIRDHIVPAPMMDFGDGSVGREAAAESVPLPFADRPFDLSAGRVRRSAAGFGVASRARHPSMNQFDGEMPVAAEEARGRRRSFEMRSAWVLAKPEHADVHARRAGSA